MASKTQLFETFESTPLAAYNRQFTAVLEVSLKWNHNYLKKCTLKGSRNCDKVRQKLFLRHVRYASIRLNRNIDNRTIFVQSKKKFIIAKNYYGKIVLCNFHHKYKTPSIYFIFLDKSVIKSKED